MRYLLLLVAALFATPAKAVDYWWFSFDVNVPAFEEVDAFICDGWGGDPDECAVHYVQNTYYPLALGDVIEAGAPFTHFEDYEISMAGAASFDIIYDGTSLHGENLSFYDGTTGSCYVDPPFSCSFFSGQLDYFAVTSPDVPLMPEPATWAMMLVGFAGVGFGLRRRSSPEMTGRHPLVRA